MKYTVRIEDQEYEVEIKDLRARPIVAIVDGVEIEVQSATADGNGYARPIPAPSVPPATYAPAVVTPAPVVIAAPPRPSPVSGAGTVRAPIPGVILTIYVKPGDTVKHGQELFIIEAMKMKNTIRSNREGVIAEVLVAPGTTVNHNTPIITYAEN